MDVCKLYNKKHNFRKYLAISVNIYYIIYNQVTELNSDAHKQSVSVHLVKYNKPVVYHILRPECSSVSNLLCDTYVIIWKYGFTKTSYFAFFCLNIHSYMATNFCRVYRNVIK